METEPFNNLNEIANDLMYKLVESNISPHIGRYAIDHIDFGKRTLLSFHATFDSTRYQILITPVQFTFGDHYIPLNTPNAIDVLLEKLKRQVMENVLLRFFHDINEKEISANYNILLKTFNRIKLEMK